MTAPSDNSKTLLDAMSVNADNGKTAKELALATGLKYSTVTGLLRDLEANGLARKEKSGRQVTWTRRDDVHTSGSGEAVDLDDVAHGGSPHESSDPDQVDGPIVTDETTTASEGATHTDAPADPGTAATDDVAGADAPDGTFLLTPDAPVVPLSEAKTAADVLGAMTAVRPIPDAPATPERAPRTRSSAPAREVRNDFGSGGLQGAVLRYMDEHPDAAPFGPYELAQALAAHASSVAYSLKRTTAKGQTVDVTTDKGKPRFRLATSAEASAHARAVADAKAAETAADAPAS